MTLIGLFARAVEYKKPIAFPHRSIKDIATNNEIPIPLDEIFQIAALLQMAESHGIEVRFDDPKRFRIGGWEYFHHGAGRVAHRPFHLTQTFADTAIGSDAVKCLMLSLHALALIEKVQYHLSGREISVAAQIRIEKDWEWHCRYILIPQATEPEDFDLTFDQILRKISKSLPSEKRFLLFVMKRPYRTPRQT